ncbi:AmmeMemoRadiSam system protein A [Sphaerochaeta sp. PS]|uniref:AmmeMemoRadiSam system protein A n=1 Tax=Sphaerochaeta sp. PS TaxID=3076336 RepID=UPI0028A34579|nr:AmmeMemoRadiSam system protein A [Sphaerochaeta sp. PS]MDT4761322.1 AmmeMemoRadiSam system protein A [Sphaerochaeta sp. PS]
MRKREHTLLLALARESISSSLGLVSNDAFTLISQDPAPVFMEKRGVFVTLRTLGGEDSHALRGCIGNLYGLSPLHKSIMELAREAAFHDPRFPAVRLDELSNLSIEISVLTKPRKIASFEEIKVGSDGVILTLGYNRAVFLPQVATEQGWGVEEMLENLCMKAGLPPNAWKDPGCELEVFQAEVFSEDTP